MPVTCPRCQHQFSGYKATRDQRNLDLGLCTACGQTKTSEEVRLGHWKCARCRAKAARSMTRLRHGIRASGEAEGSR